ncbi:HhH-GPD family protein [Listeria weihenstephanensis FSL R9-0317]|uniref:Endonuclease n=1 Tax=Listeria weihenstephanensis TaxID=1006155 RepID=A0A1S7FRX4_9LIST|nr:endonuclease III domain-containing protein [Listeria weihenstephanensis]AQY50119.1 endonuclease [Listeria weihenstephanensis]EUJ36622.1 HhH-GPD family protein [Listeria weihenstephanensis FSL R9-0317]
MIGVREVYGKLLNELGYQEWWPAETDFEMMIGAILTQNTNWKNVEKAFVNLEGVLEPEKIQDMELEELAQRIRPSGFFNQKAIKIKAFVAWFEMYDFNVDEVKKQPMERLRAELLAINGIGPETADCMLAYAFDKPILVIDAYTRRVFGRVGYEVPKKYDDFRQMLEAHMPNELQVLQEFHALIVMHCKNHCLKTPICQGCPLENDCLKIGVESI